MSDEIKFRNKIVIISFACSLMVIWIHTHNLDIYAIDSSSISVAKIVYNIEKYWRRVNSIAVPYFFFISGYLFFRTFDIHNILYKYKTRAKSVIIPYAIWCTVYYLYFVAFTNIPFLRQFTNAETVRLSITNWLLALWEKEYYTLWFLKELIIYIILCPLLYIILKNYGRLKVGLMTMLFFLLNNYFGWIDFRLSGLIFYGMGSYMAINHKGGTERRYSRNQIAMAVICTILLIAIHTFILQSSYLLLLFILSSWIALDGIKYSGGLPWWMKITFFIYVAHDIILEMLEKIFLLIFGTAPVFALIDYMIMPFMTYLCLCIVSYFMRKYSPVLWRLLSGGRG